MRNVLTLVLGGGQGTRLFPLTKVRSKPAVPLAGKYRLIDIPLSNCINSGPNRIYVLTQFNSVSLHRHIRATYTFDAFSGGFVELLAAQQTFEGTDWYQGTADAVRKNLRYLKQPYVDNVLILSGDQLYRMDFQEMLRTHQESNAEVSIASMPVEREDAKSLGVMRMNPDGSVGGFVEKPQTEEELAPALTPSELLDARGVDSKGRDCLASMGIYLFNRNTLVELLEQSTHEDFGREVFPEAIHSRKVHVHLFDDYWEDIGTIGAFYEANLELAKQTPPFELASETAPLYSRARFLPPSRLDGVTVKGSLIADGCTIGEGTVIENSVIGLRCQIGKNVVVKDSILMGADYYEAPEEVAADLAAGDPVVGLGDGSVVHKAIIDKNTHIGKNARVVNDSGVEERDVTESAYVRDGIIVVARGGVLPNNWKMDG
ncbi:MAG: glucose-1-phosphate adenylyltransferase [Planctomycetales bacterium]